MLAVDWPSVFTEEAGDVATLFPTSTPDAPGLEGMLLSLVTLEVTELDDALEPKDVVLLFKKSELVALCDAPGSEGAVLSLKACKTVELDEIPNFKDALLLLKAFELDKLEDASEFREFPVLLKTLVMVESDDALELKGIVPLLKGSEVTELDDGKTVLDVLATVVEPFTKLPLEPENVDE